MGKSTAADKRPVKNEQRLQHWSWAELTRRTKQADQVVLVGWERYFGPYIQRLWIEQVAQLPLVLDQPTPEQVLDALRPVLAGEPRPLVVRRFSPPEGELRMILEATRKRRVLVSLDGRVELLEKEQAWLFGRQSRNFLAVRLHALRWYESRKREWAGEILRGYGVVAERRAVGWVLDHCQWDLAAVESTARALQLLIEDGEALSHQRVQALLVESEPPGGTHALVRSKLDGYYSGLMAQVQALAGDERRALLNRHLRMADQMRALLLIDRGQDLQGQYDQVARTSPYPMSFTQFQALVNGPSFSRTDCLEFLARSSEFLADYFL